MEEDILDAEWETPKRNLTNTILGIVILNPFMHFVIMPMEQTLSNSHSFSPISPLVFLVMITCLVVGIRDLLRKKSKSINYLLIGFNLIFWIYMLSQIECIKYSQA